ncbi:MUC5B protein, partial [Polypterus senegalus]|nr:MUC5B protein [Polypterus senegalus]
MAGTTAETEASVTFVPPINAGPLLISRSPAQNNKVCSIWGNFHIKMYDGEVYQFPGTCNYVLTSHCGSNYEDFNIQIRKNVVNEQPKIIHVTMKLDGTVVTVSGDTISVDDKQILLPYNQLGIQIEKSSLYVKIKAKSGVMVTWNGEDALMVEMPEKYMNETCGLCGDFNGIENHGGFYANGIKVTPTEFGNLQKFDGPEETCEDVLPQPTSKNAQNVQPICEQILSSPVFANCIALLSITSFVQACVMDMVDCGKNKTSSCLCHTVSEYSRQCANAGGRPQNWRTAEFCGMVLDDITKKGCIPLTKCSCTHNGQVYHSGQSYSSNCRSCTCNGGLWTCKDLDCPGTCAVEGGSHITSFDGTQFTFHGDCTYLLSKDHVDNRFAILSEIVKCGLTNTETCLKSVTLSLPTTNTVIMVNPAGEMYVNGILTQLPLNTGNFTAFNPSTFHVIIDTSFGLQLQIQLSPLMQVYVTIDASYKSNTCGLCGNFNNVQTDDFNTASGVTEGTASAFANTWKTMATCPDVLDSYEDPCSQSVENEQFAKRWCSLLSDPSGPFSPCHSVIISTSYEKNCMYDICTYEQSEDSMCAAVSSYVRACAAKGVFLTGWRSTICTKYSTSCPKTMTYSYRMTSCDHTCRSLSEPDFTCSVQFVPVDGCGCKQGTYMNQNGECVQESECPCYNKGSVLLAGEIVSRDGAMCTCSNGKLRCMGSDKPKTVCKQPMTYLNCSTLPLGSPGAECQKSCQTLHMECYSKGCVSGCVCPKGLVSNGHGKCIPASQCPCIHNGITYKPGEKIQVGCNTCTCKDQKWQCTNLQCHGSCVMQGEGHHLTFDGKRFSFSGNCEYTVAQDYCGINSNNGTFRVITENIPCGSTGTTCSKAIKLFLGKDELRLSEGQYELMKRDVGVDMAYKIMHMGIYVVIETKTGLILMWDKKTSVHIKLSASFKGNVCGLCGNYDGNANNDFTTRSQSLVVNALEFGNGWKVSPNCPDAKVPKDPCTSNPYRKSWALKQCSIIKSKVFAACHPQVDPSPYFDACVYDSCACDSGGDCECFCTSVAAYAAACNEAKVCVSWRKPNLCPLFCDYYNGPDQCEWHYKPCGVPCMRTCRNPSGTCSSQIPGLEGCYPKCPPRKPFFDEDSMKCVARKDCGCYDKQDRHYQLGEKMPSSNVCQTCVCSQKGVQCHYDVMACKCIYNMKEFPLNAVIYNTTDGLGDCITATCKENGTIQRDMFPCAATTTASTTAFVFNTTVPPSTVPTQYLSSMNPTSATSSQPKTTCEEEVCKWSIWYNVDGPDLGDLEGDYETFENIIKKGYAVCQSPVSVECRSHLYPDTPITQLKQAVQCNKTFGLICKHEDQHPTKCLDYEVRILCCVFTACHTTHETISTAFISTSLPTAEVTSSPTTCRRQCQWSDWYDTHFPSLGKNDGDFETYQNIQQKGGNICANPAKIECRAEKYPNKTLQEVNQIVQCNVSVGLQCKNEDQDGEFPLCYNYQIRVLCCGIYYCETTVTQAGNTTLLPSTSSGNEVSNPSGYPLSSTVSSTLEEIKTSNVTPFSTTNEKTHRSFTTSIVPTTSNTFISTGISSASSTTLRLSTVMSTALETNIITSGTGTVKSTTKKTTKSQPTSEYVKELTETLPTLIIPSDFPSPFTVTDKSIVTLPLNSDTTTESSSLTKTQGLSTKPKLTTIISAITPVISTEHVSYSTSQLSESSSSQGSTRPLSKSTSQQTTVTTEMLDKSTDQVSKSTSQKTTEKTTSQKTTEKTTYLITTRPVSKINTLSSTELITKTSHKITEATSSPKPTGDVSKTTSWKTTEKPISSLSTVPVSKTTSQIATEKITSSLFTGSVSKTTLQKTTEKTTSPLPTDLVSKTTILRSTETTTSLSTDLGSKTTSHKITEKTISPKTTEYVSKTTSWKTSEKTAISLSIGPVSTSTSHSMTEKTTSPKPTGSVTSTTSLKSTERTVSPASTETMYKTTSQKTEKTTSFSTGVVSKTTMPKTSDKMTSTKSTEPVSKTTSWKTTGKSAASSLFTEPVSKTTSQRITVMSTNSNTTETVSQTASQKTTAKATPTVPATKTTLQKTEKTTSLSTGILSKTTSQKITDTKSTLPVSKTTPLKTTGITTHSMSTGSISKSTSNTTTTKTTFMSTGLVSKTTLQTTIEKISSSGGTTRPTSKSTSQKTTSKSVSQMSSTPATRTTKSTFKTTTSPVITHSSSRTFSTTTPRTTPCKPKCAWSQWYDVSKPSKTSGGEFETIENIQKAGLKVCINPKQIKCRAVDFPQAKLSSLNQKVSCNYTFGLRCINKNQPQNMCYNYEVSFQCCTSCTQTTAMPYSTIPASIRTENTTATSQRTTSRKSTLVQTTKTSSEIPTSGHQSQMSSSTSKSSSSSRSSTPVTSTSGHVSSPVSATMKSTMHRLSTTEKPTSQQMTILQGSTAHTTFTSGRFSTQEGSTTHRLSTSHESTTHRPSMPGLSTTPVKFSSSSPSISTTHCVCSVNGQKFQAGQLIYNTTDENGWCYTAFCNATCGIQKSSRVCSSTPSPSSSSKMTTPFTTEKGSTSTSVKVETTIPAKTGCSAMIPPRKINETWMLDKCTKATCKGHDQIRVTPVQCKPVQPLTCVNGRPARKIYDSSGCCYRYECECVCTTWGYQHHMTFDGTYYQYSSNCTRVLVEEITSKNDHFLVSVDDGDCFKKNQDSCTRSLWIFYQGNKLFLTADEKNLVYFNGNLVSRNIVKNGFKIYSTGISIHVTILDINVHIAYDRMITVITLPYQRFFNNTQGLCGTCTNLQNDDCRLPNGKIESSCVDMAEHWTTPNQKACIPVLQPTSQPTLPSSSFMTSLPSSGPSTLLSSSVSISLPSSTPSTSSIGSSSLVSTTLPVSSSTESHTTPVTTKPTKNPVCKPPLCKLITSSIFAECHSLLPSEPYYAACVVDSCQMNKVNPECSSLQNYAAMCADLGVCVDWRNHTNGKCDCVGPDGMPKKPNEIWQSNCHQCFCDKESLSVQCKPLVCPKLLAVSCDKEGQVAKSEPMANNSCCSTTKCVPKNVCVFNNTEYQGFTYQDVPGQCCGKCVQVACIFPMPIISNNITNSYYTPSANSGSPQGSTSNPNENSSAGGNVTPNGNTAKSTGSNSSPNRTDDYTDSPIHNVNVTPTGNNGLPTSKGSPSIIPSDNSTYIVEPGHIITFPGDNCTHYECLMIDGQYVPITSKKSCPEFHPENCLPGTIRLSNDGCCQTCDEKPEKCRVLKKPTIMTHEGCQSQLPVEVSSCEGTCKTYSMYLSEANIIGHKCSCCQEKKTSLKNVALDCANGTTISHTYIYVEQCGCKDTRCEVKDHI